MENNISQYTKYLKIEKCLSPATIRIYKNDLTEFKDYLGQKTSIKSINRNRLRGFLCFLERKHNQPITRRRKLTTLRNFFEYLKDEKKLKENPTKSIALPKVAIKEPSYFTEKEIKEIVAEIQKDKTRYQKRNLLMFTMLTETGIRIGELTGLNVSDLDLDNELMTVKRKGGHIQIMPVTNSLTKHLKEFIKDKTFTAPLFISSFKTRITQRRANMLIQGYINGAGIKKSKASAHSLRHSFCSRLLDKGVNLKTIQILAGHKSIATTERYLHIAKERLRQGIKLAQI